MDKPTRDEQIARLTRQLAETKAALKALAVDPEHVTWDAGSSSGPAHHSLRDSQIDLEEQVRRQAIELGRANRLLQALIETMPIGAVVTDGGGNLLTTNYAGRAILGSAVYGSLDSPERSYTPHFPDGTPLPSVDMPLMQALREGRVIRDVEILIRRVDEDERIILASAAPVQDETGAIVSGIAVFQDISDRKQAQRALQRYARRLQALHETDQAILAARTVQEIARSALRHTPELLGCVGSSITLLDPGATELSLLVVHPEGQAELNTVWHSPWSNELMVEVLSQGTVFAVEDVEGLPPSPLLARFQAEGVRSFACVPLIVQGELVGSLNLGMSTARPLSPTQEEIAWELANQVAIAIQQARLNDEVQHYALHLEERVARRTAALQASEARFRAIFEDSILGIALLDAQGLILAGNPTLQNMLGLSEAELTGKNLRDFSHPADVEVGEDLFEAVAQGELDFYQVDRRLVRRDGQTRWSELTVSRIKRTQKGISGLAIAMVADITEKRMSQEALRRAERQAIAGRLGPSLAHEINNPLQSVIGCLGLAEEMLYEGAEARRYLEIATEELDRVAGIVAQLRDLGQEQKVKPKEPADLNAIVETALFLTRKRCQNQRVEVVWIPSDSLPTVPLVPDRMQQVVLNLVLNAIDAMPGGGQLQVSTALSDRPHGVTIRVADTGVGIESERLGQLFEPFHSTRSEGLGLGLYVSKNIVEEHGGRIEVTSTIGQGTTFTVWLPR